MGNEHVLIFGEAPIPNLQAKQVELHLYPREIHMEPGFESNNSIF